MKRNIRSIAYRLEKLEKDLKGVELPIVKLLYENGHKATFYGTPPIEAFNGVSLAYGSDFANLINAVLHPVPNRNIEDLEREA